MSEQRGEGTIQSSESQLRLDEPPGERGLWVKEGYDREGMRVEMGVGKAYRGPNLGKNPPPRSRPAKPPGSLAPLRQGSHAYLRATRERVSSGACEPLTSDGRFCTIFSRRGRSSGLRFPGEARIRDAPGLSFSQALRRRHRGGRGGKPHRAAENAGQTIGPIVPTATDLRCRLNPGGPEPSLRGSGL